MLRVKGFVEVGGKPMRLLAAGGRPARQPLLRPRLDGRRRPPLAAGRHRPEGAEPPGDRAYPRRLRQNRAAMHILTTTSASLDDLAEPVDLRQTPADIVALSFTDSDLSGLAAAWKADADAPAVDAARRTARSAPSDVRRPLDRQRRARHAKVILVRILGGYDWWRYGCDQLAAIARDTRHQTGAAARRDATTRICG